LCQRRRIDQLCRPSLRFLYSYSCQTLFKLPWIELYLRISPSSESWRVFQLHPGSTIWKIAFRTTQKRERRLRSMLPLLQRPSMWMGRYGISHSSPLDFHYNPLVFHTLGWHWHIASGYTQYWYWSQALGVVGRRDQEHPVDFCAKFQFQICMKPSNYSGTWSVGCG
jgi:hypothetical protein